MTMQRAVVAGLVAMAVLAGCGGHRDPLSGPDATPPARTAVATTVDVCELVPMGAASRRLDRSLLVISRTVDAARQTTVQCDLGERFGESLVTVTLAPEPVALDVFDTAYGKRAGGNPKRVQGLGDAAYLRTEDIHRIIHVLVHGAVLSVSALAGPIGSDGTVSRAQLVRLAKSAVTRLPENPVVETDTAPRPCALIDATVLASTLGRPPTLDSGVAFGNGSLVCSWSGQPGSVTVTITKDAAEISRFLAQHPLNEDLPVEGILPRGQGLAYSSPRTAGDLVVLVGQDQLMTLQVVPASGYANASIDTSASERAVAKAGLALLAS